MLEKAQPLPSFLELPVHRLGEARLGSRDENLGFGLLARPLNVRTFHPNPA